MIRIQAGGQISDHQQSVAPVPSRAILIPPALLVVADFFIYKNKSQWLILLHLILRPLEKESLTTFFLT